MAADTKLLPLPWSDIQPNGRRWLFKPEDRPRVEDYARENVAHATAAQDAEIARLTEALEFQSALTKNLLPYQDEAVASRAEIEALRVDVEAWKASHSMLTDTCHHFQARAKRLAETLQKLAAHARPTCSVLWDEAQAALRDHDQEERK